MRANRKEGNSERMKRKGKRAVRLDSGPISRGLNVKVKVKRC